MRFWCFWKQKHVNNWLANNESVTPTYPTLSFFKVVWRGSRVEQHQRRVELREREAGVAHQATGEQDPWPEGAAQLGLEHQDPTWGAEGPNPDPWEGKSGSKGEPGHPDQRDPKPDEISDPEGQAHQGAAWGLQDESAGAGEPDQVLLDLFQCIVPCILLY